MPPTYTVEIDTRRSLLLLALRGFFTVEAVREFALARNAAVARLSCPPNQHLTLCDARGSMLSKPEVAAEFQALLADPHYASRRLAYVVDGALARMQAGRVLNRPNLAFFSEKDEAMTWLFSES